VTRARLEAAAIAVGLVVMFALLPHDLTGDDHVRFSDIEALLSRGQVSDDGYSYAMPLLSAPFLALGKVVKSQEWWAARFNVIVVAAAVPIAFRLLRGRVDPALLRRTVLVLLAASLLTNRLRDYNAELLTAALFTLGSLCLATRRHVLLGWAGMVLGAVNTPAAVVALALVAVAQTVRERRLRWLLPIGAAALLIMAEAWTRRGGPLTTGYEGNHGPRTVLPYSGEPGFSYPFVLGVLAILFSFGRGLAFYVPALWLGLSGRTRALARPYRWALALLLVALAGLVVVYAKWWAWQGGQGWGPRFFVLATVPASFFLALRIGAAGRSTAADAVTLAALAASAWVAVAGADAALFALNFCGENGETHAYLCWFTPEYSSLWQTAVHFPSLTGPAVGVTAYCAAVFAYLAAPLVASLARWRPPAGLRFGWRL
jgi:hypothetical protein